MKTTNFETKSIEVIDTVTCNKCGSNIEFNIVEYLQVYLRGVYFNEILEDETEYEFDLCEKCVDELMKTFKIPVKTFGDI